MTDSPNPWSREGMQSSGQFNQSAQPAHTTQPARSASRPQFQHSTTPQQHAPAGSLTPPTMQFSAQQAQAAPQPQPAVKKPRRSGKLVAGFLAVAMLAAGVGAGSAVVADHYLGDDQPTAVASSDPSQEAQGQTVAQADPNNPDWSAVADVAQQSAVAIQIVGQQGSGQGSGVVIDDVGHIITNNHVVSGARAVLATLNGQQYEAEVVGTDPSTDLAVIQLTDPPEDLSPIAWGDSNALAVGDPVMAIGNPLGLSNTVTTGIVSALDRPVTTRTSGSSGSEAVVTAAVQTSAAINPGNSGGALVNASGELVGITTSIATVSGSESGQSGNIGIGFAIASDQARNVAEQLINDGEATHAQIGVTARDLQEVGPMGAEVAEVVEGSPAAEAGLQPGDVITAVNDRPVSSTTQLVGMIRAQAVGEEIAITYERDNEEHTVQLAPAAASQ